LKPKKNGSIRAHSKQAPTNEQTLLSFVLGTNQARSSSSSSSSASLAQTHLTKREEKKNKQTNKQMPYQFQQAPKILDTGIIKMQASVATALLLFSFPPTIKTSIPLQVSPFFLLLLLLICPGQFIKQIDPAKQQLLLLLPSWSSAN